MYEDLSLADLSERGLELTIWDHDRLASNEFLGGIRFSLGTGRHSSSQFILIFTNLYLIATYRQALWQKCRLERRKWKGINPMAINDKPTKFLGRRMFSIKVVSRSIGYLKKMCHFILENNSLLTMPPSLTPFLHTCYTQNIKHFLSNEIRQKLNSFQVYPFIAIYILSTLLQHFKIIIIIKDVINAS